MPVGAQIPLPLPSPSDLIPPNPLISLGPPPFEPPPPPQESGGGSEEAPPPPQPAPAPQPAAPAAKPPAPGAASSGRALKVPGIRRTRPGSTGRLVAIAAPLIDLGMSAEEAMLKVAPPFPVAGMAWYSHDFNVPRYDPYPHLHEGTDVFADFGTPIVASGPGTVAAMAKTVIGGISVWVAGDDGTSYYYAHLLSFAKELHAGQRVEMGTVIGYVGNTGNARNTSPHLHFEIHPPAKDRRGRVIASGVGVGPGGAGATRTPAVDPKPFLDGWLEEAEARAEATVAEAIGQLGGLSRQVRFSRRVGELYSADSVGRPRELLWFSALQPALGALGLARQAAVTAGVAGPPGSSAERSALAERRAAARTAVEAATHRLEGLVGSFGRSDALSVMLTPPLG